MNSNFRRLKAACYMGSMSMSVVANLPPILFLTFRSLYGLSFTQLGLFVVLNFVTQLGVDLLFSFFSRRFNIPKTVKWMPFFSILGFLIYALWPFFFPESAFFGLMLGTVIFSASSGLGEVLISPVLATIPSPDPDREMSKLHSMYAWGSVPVIIISSLLLLFLEANAWQVLVFLFLPIPILALILYVGCDIPEMQATKEESDVKSLLKRGSLWLCVLAIFLGGAAETAMAQWASGYLEVAFSIPKVWGDTLGVALFSLMLGIGRLLYGKVGKNINRVLLLCTLGATACYFICAVTQNPILGLIFCAFTGLCVSMLWPGNLLVGAAHFPESGVFIYAMMAAGGDLGASVAPQLVGVVTDFAMENSWILSLAEGWLLAPEQLGMRLGMLFGMLFPLSAIPIHVFLLRKKKASSEPNE